ncbi:MAG TPA: Asp23/Gls24 family envelope stress response protein [Clostridiaceae bacterium]|nr:Asp23/Gls24 family envelope stress response protein [Clostridiaceae bacterium]
MQGNGGNSVKGERTMSRGFIAQYAAEAAMQTPGVIKLAPGGAAVIREALGVESESKGVQVFFDNNNENSVTITVYPVIEFGMIIPEIAWSIQENVKMDVEEFTGLSVEAVNVHVIDIVYIPDPLPVESEETEGDTDA